MPSGGFYMGWILQIFTVGQGFPVYQLCVYFFSTCLLHVVLNQITPAVSLAIDPPPNAINQ